MIDRSEIFDEEDIDAAIARFDELSRRTPRLENTASRVNARIIACVTRATGTRWLRFWPTTFAATIGGG